MKKILLALLLLSFVSVAGASNRARPCAYQGCYDRPMYDRGYSRPYHGYNRDWSDSDKVIAGLLVLNLIAEANKPAPDPVSEAYKAGVRARQAEEQRRAAEKAYNCGYTGDC